MIQTQTILKVADNSGALTAKCIKLLTPRRYASVGDCILVSIRCVRGGTLQSVKKGQISKALIIRTKKSRGSQTYGISWAFQENAVVLLDNQGNLTGSRIFGSITRDLRARNYRKIISQSKRML